MIFKFKNVGIVEKAEIELKGLTVLTGLNDTGKSFISKSIYALIKTIKDSSVQELNEKTGRLDVFWIGIRNVLNLTRKPEVQLLFEKDILPLRAKIFVDLTNKIPAENIIQKISDFETEILNIEALSDQSINKQLITHFKAIKDNIRISKKEEEKYSWYFNKIMIQQLFKKQINCLCDKANELEISWKEGDSEILNVKIINNKIVEFKLNNLYTSLLHFQDATIIDSPIILHITNLILKNRLDVNRNQELPMPLYYSDLVSKFLPLANPQIEEVNTRIQEVIKGKVVFEEKTNKIVYLKENGHQIESFNIANGIKAFGVLQLLLNSGSINRNSVLIIDEPEVHLHPEWEIEYAEIIVMLSKLGIPVLVSTHSPYMLQALPFYVKKYNTEEITKFYFGEKLEGKMTSVFKDVTEDLEPIFNALAKPMQKLL
jgi:predicted ATP-dependent endonuclease of OLD family